MIDHLALLRQELATLWVSDERGRLCCARTPDRRPAPLVTVAACADGVTWACSASLAGDRLDAVAELLGREPSPGGRATVGWEPAAAAAILARLGAVVRVERGPSFVVDTRPPLVDGVACWTNADDVLDRLAGHMPEADRTDLAEPWAVGLVAGEVAAVCETSRSAPTSVEAGVWTYERHRRRGFGTAVTAVWATLVEDRTAFYSTSADNVASQGVARRLGLQPLGQLWSVHGVAPA